MESIKLKHINHSELLTDSITLIAKNAISLYSNYFPNSHAAKEFNLFLKMEQENVTKLRLNKRAPIDAFYKSLIANGCIAKNTPLDSIKSLVNGRVPKKMIIWSLEERHLRYFIKQYCETGKLVKPNKQPFKICDQIFTVNGILLKKGWAVSKNKLNDINSIRILDEVLTHLP